MGRQTGIHKIALCVVIIGQSIPNEVSGLVIGTVTNVQTEAGGQIEYGIVEPQANIDSLVQVFIIKDFNVVE